MIDREHLATTLNFFEARPDITGRPNTDRFKIVLAAAHRHLETLPKPVWRVTYTLRLDNRRGAPFDSDSHEAALNFARSVLAEEHTDVSVRRVPE